MPKVLLKYDPSDGEYYLYSRWDHTPGEYEAVVEIKASTYKRLTRNIKRWVDDQLIMERFFIEAQMAGRNIREQ